MWIIKNRKIFYGLSFVMIVFSLSAVLTWGLNFGIDFTGGSILEFDYTEQHVDKNLVEEVISAQNADLGSFSLRETNKTGYILKTKTLSDLDKNTLINDLKDLGELQEKRFNTIGPTLGNELKSKALISFILVLVSIILFIAFAFRHVSKPVSSWKYGLVAVTAFLHDVLVPIGLFSVLGRFYGVEVDTLFVVAILVVLGYSINDTIVVFDRIRENLREYPDKKRMEQFESVVGKSLKQTIARSLNTSITTLIALFAIYFLGGESTRYFALALIAGIISGTYSSIFFASPMLVSLKRIQERRNSKNVTIV